jgi:Uma2 family endonuclease
MNESTTALLPDDLEPAWDIARLFPPQGSWSEDEYLHLPGNHLTEFDHGRIEVLRLDTATRTYLEHGVFSQGDTANSPTLAGFELELTDLFAAADGTNVPS